MRMWQLGSCFPISVLLSVITSVKILLLYRRHASLLVAESDFLNLCEHKVHCIADLVNGGNLLNKRQCMDLSAKLSKAFKNIREMVLHCGASSTVFFRPALENLYRTLEKARLLVSNCGHEDWCASSVFQIQNEKAFQEILLELGLCYNAIYEQAKGTSKEWNSQLEDLRESSTFQQASTSDVDADNHTLQNWLKDLANEYSSSRLSVLDRFLPRRLVLKQSLARYLLVKLKCVSQPQSQSKDDDKSSAILWTEDTEPSGTWRDECYLGAGAGAKVWSTKWLGIPCAKKVFQGINTKDRSSRDSAGKSTKESGIFSKEAGILAYLNHPRVVKFFCCGSSQETGDGFIAMELMEMSLCDLIRRQTNPFPLPVAIDMIMQIARGMCYLHEVKVAHRDLKPQNVVVNRLTYPHPVGEYYCVKLVDFGMSKTKVEVHRANTISVCGVGTTIYRAPEVHPQAHPEGEGKAMWFKADVYSFAVTCAQILNLQRPYNNVKFSKLYDELISGLRPVLPEDCPQELVSLLKDCWNLTPNSRPSFSEICSRLEAFSHKFIWMTMVKPSSMQRSTVAESDDAKVERLASSGCCSAGGNEEANTFTGDAHKNAQALANDLSEEPAIVPLSNSESSRARKPRRSRNNKAGVDKPLKSEVTKITAEVALHKSNSGEGKKTKELNGRKFDDSNTTTGNEKKRRRRKQAPDESTADAPTGKLPKEVPTPELKKRPRRDAVKKLEEGTPRLNEGWIGANWPEELTRRLSAERGSFKPHLWHISDGDDGEELTIVLKRPAVATGRNGRKNPGSTRSRVKSVSSRCPRVG